jgi:hypothetical protein
MLEHLLEQARLLIHAVADTKTTLQQPATGEAGDERHQRREGPPSRHGSLGWYVILSVRRIG